MNKNDGFSEESLRRIAAQKVTFRYSIKIHLVVYILINALLIFINLITSNFKITFETSWFLFPLLGWLVGLALHILSYFLYAKGVFPFAKRGVIYNAITYIFVMILLIVSNLLTMPELFWFLWPCVFWGAAVIGHFIIYMIYFKARITDTGDIKSRRELAIEKEMEKMRRKMQQG